MSPVGEIIAAVFEFAGKAIVVLAFAFAVILAAPFMLLGWLAVRAGWVSA
jgi:hypothetical protein